MIGQLCYQRQSASNPTTEHLVKLLDADSFGFEVSELAWDLKVTGSHPSQENVDRAVNNTVQFKVVGKPPLPAPQAV